MAIQKSLPWVKNNNGSFVLLESDFQAMQAIFLHQERNSSTRLIISYCMFILSSLINVGVGFVERSMN